MTVGEFLKLPSRERDAIVANRAMGGGPDTLQWVVERRDDGRIVTSCCNEHWATIFLHENDFDDEWRVAAHPKPYTTDPARALEVMEAVPGHWWRIQSPFRPGTPYWVGLTEHDFTGWNGRMESQVAANTREELPAACCAVALLALGVLTQ